MQCAKNTRMSLWVAFFAENQHVFLLSGRYIKHMTASLNKYYIFFVTCSKKGSRFKAQSYDEGVCPCCICKHMHFVRAAAGGTQKWWKAATEKPTEPRLELSESLARFWPNVPFLPFALCAVIWTLEKCPFPRTKLMARLLSVIKVIQARRTWLQPSCYLFHVVSKPSCQRWDVVCCQTQGQGRSARNNGRSLSAGSPDIHESVGASKDVRPSAENHHCSLSVITFSLRRLNKHRPSSCPSVPQGCSTCPKLSCAKEWRKMDWELRSQRRTKKETTH